MRWLLASLLAFLACSVHAESVNPFRPVAVVSLTDGRILQNFSVTSYTLAGVNGRWVGGQGIIAYELFPEAWAPIFQRFRPSAPPPSPPQKLASSSVLPPQFDDRPLVPLASSTERSGAKQRIRGQCFIVTHGRANVELGGQKICIYPADILTQYLDEITQRWDSFVAARRAWLGKDSLRGAEYQSRIFHQRWSLLPSPEFSTTTDAEGRFSISHNIVGPFYVFVFGSRRVAEETEHYTWLVHSRDIADPENLILSNQNML